MRVEVDDAVERLVGRLRLLLGRDPVPDRAEVVARGASPGGLDPREHAWHGGVRLPGLAGSGCRRGSASGTLDRDVVRGAHPRLRGAVRPPAAPDPQAGGRALGGVAVGDRRRVPHRARAHGDRSTSTSPPSSCSSPPPSWSSRPAASCPGLDDARARRGAAPLRGARPAARPPARVQDVQGRRPTRSRRRIAPRRPQRAAHRRPRGAVPLAGARPARARAARARCAPPRCAMLAAQARRRSSTPTTSPRSAPACATRSRPCCACCPSRSR